MIHARQNTSTAREPERISMLGFVDEFMRIHETMEDRAFAFILGAGASRTSGIKTAAQMVQGWIETLHRRALGATTPADTWANAATLGIDTYDPDNPAAAYPALYQRMYRDDPGSGYAFLEAQMRVAEPSYGYSVLGRILATERHRVVITTNFDNLVADSLSLFSATYPLVCGHEALAPFVRTRLRRPLVVKVHHDLLLNPKSMPEELAGLPDGFSRALTDLLGHYTPIVIGYGGNDGSLMGFLEQLPDNAIPGGVYWCYWEGGPPPPDNIRGFVARQRGKLVPIPGFDELMTVLGEALGFDVPDKYVLDRAKERADRIVRQARQLKESLGGGLPAAPAPSPVAASEPKAEPRRDPQDLEQSAVLGALQRTMGRRRGPRRWWQWQDVIDQETDVARKRALYDAALRALPESVDLLGNYAAFLRDRCKDIDAAERMYRRALEIDRENAHILGNYALLLGDNRHDFVAAEAMYKEALDFAPHNANILCNYARFLRERRGDRDAAEALYRRALAVNSSDPYDLTVLAHFALTAGHIKEGLELVERVLVLRKGKAPAVLDVECLMYAYCCRLPAKQPAALARLRKLVVRDNVRIAWDFSDVLALAKQMDHPEAGWLPQLAAVLADEAPVDTLDVWQAWQDAGG